MRLRRPDSAEDPLVEYPSFEEFEKTKNPPNGRFSIEFKNLPVDFLYENRGYATTVVIFHGAILTTVDLPFHTAAGVMSGVKANRLTVSDPTLLLGNDLKLGWFAGSTQQVGLQRFIETVIRKINELASVNHVVFFGASGGGFSALEMSARFVGSLAVPMNPQTSITKYHQPSVALYVDVAWGSIPPFTEGNDLLTHDLVDSYPNNPVNTVAYIQNSRDRVHIRDHQRPFFAKVGQSPNVWQLMGAWGEPKQTGHTTPPKEISANILAKAAESNGDWQTGLVASGFHRVATSPPTSAEA